MGGWWFCMVIWRKEKCSTPFAILANSGKLAANIIRTNLSVVNDNNSDAFTSSSFHRPFQLFLYQPLHSFPISQISPLGQRHRLDNIVCTIRASLTHQNHVQKSSSNTHLWFLCKIPPLRHTPSSLPSLIVLKKSL